MRILVVEDEKKVAKALEETLSLSPIKGEYADLDVSVKGKALSGKVDQGIGLVFRFRDPKSYYVVRANALENNFRLYRMVNGRRLQFAGANVKIPSGKWHTARRRQGRSHYVLFQWQAVK